MSTVVGGIQALSSLGFRCMPVVAEHVSTYQSDGFDSGF